MGARRQLATGPKAGAQGPGADGPGSCFRIRWDYETLGIDSSGNIRLVNRFGGIRQEGEVVRGKGRQTEEVIPF
jgi:hypothetical protein